jgi:hypothetical protein
MQRPEVHHSKELARVLGLPRRPAGVDSADATALAQGVTAALRTPAGTMTLNNIQARGLYEAWEQQGGLFPIGVGRGKTLLSLLLALVLESSRPLLVLPAGLITKTKRELQHLACHFRIPTWIRMISYEIMGRVQAKNLLFQFQPDLIVFDEAHLVKNRKAAVTRRFDRYITARREIEAAAGLGVWPRGGHLDELEKDELGWLLNLPRLRVVAMSGTITSKSLKDFAHIAQWCLPHHSPVPWTWVELEQWALALDDLVNPFSRIDPGALLSFCDERENDAEDMTTAARRGFQRRLVETPGVVATTDGHSCEASIRIEPFEPPPSRAIDQAFETLRRWELPDGWELIDGPAVYRHARELSLGFFYVWDPRPPKVWSEARSCWASFARGVIKGGKYDSEEDVALHAHEFRVTVDDIREQRKMRPLRDGLGVPLSAVDSLGLSEDALIARGSWHVADHWWSVREAFRPNKRAVWVCDSMLRACTDWMRKHPKGIVWVEHVEFGQELERVSGFPYFGRKGLDKAGRLIDTASGPVIASIDANKAGRNLQFNWSDNLITACMSDGLEFEQLIGRTHRDGQREDTVTFSILTACVEHAAAFDKALSRARYMQDTTGNAQKLCFADRTMPTADEIADLRGSRWEKSRATPAA